MRSRPVVVVVAVLLCLLAPLVVADAQQPANVPRIGFFRPAPPSPEAARILEAFKGGLREQGYVEGQNVAVDIRYPTSTTDPLAGIAADLIRQKPAAIFAAASSGIDAVRKATTAIPIVALDLETDPLASGIVASLDRPGGTSPASSWTSPSSGANGWNSSRKWLPRSRAWPSCGILRPGVFR